MDMGGLPDLIFVIDTNKETSRSRRQRLGIRFAAIVDTNSIRRALLRDPRNDDAARQFALLRPDGAR